MDIFYSNYLFVFLFLFQLAGLARPEKLCLGMHIYYTRRAPDVIYQNMDVPEIFLYFRKINSEIPLIFIFSVIFPAAYYP